MSLILLSTSLGLGFLLDLQFGLVLLGYAASHDAVLALSEKDRPAGRCHSVELLQLPHPRRGLRFPRTPLSRVVFALPMFLFLSLAMAKRYSELLNASELVRTGNSGRGYHTGDRDLLLSLGVGSSFSAVVIFSLYVHSPDVRLLYLSPELLFLLCPIVLYWLSRTWLLAHRGELKEDPVTLAIRDPVSYAVALASAVVIAASMIHINW